jgi:hypothetical protein
VDQVDRLSAFGAVLEKIILPTLFVTMSCLTLKKQKSLLIFKTLALSALEDFMQSLSFIAKSATAAAIFLLLSCKTRQFNGSSAKEDPLDASNIASIGSSLDEARQEYFTEGKPFYLSGDLSVLQVAREKAALEILAEAFQKKLADGQKMFSLPGFKGNDQRQIALQTKASMLPHLKKLHAKAMFDCSQGPGKCQLQSTRAGVWKEIFTSDLIPPPPTINRDKVFQYISQGQNLRFIDGFPKFSGSSEATALEDDYRQVCQRKIKGDRDDKDFYLWHIAEAKHPLFPSRDLTFFLGALGNTVKGKFAGFTYCVAAILDGTMGPKDEIIDYVKALNALGPKELQNKQKFVVNGVQRTIQPAPDLSEFLVKLGLPQRFADKVNFPGPVGLSAGVKDLYVDEEFKVSIGVDLRQPGDKKLWILTSREMAGESEIATLTATANTTLKLMEIEGGTDDNKETAEDLCEIKEGQTLSVSSMVRPAGSDNFHRIRLLGNLKCPLMGRHVFAKAADFKVTKILP